MSETGANRYDRPGLYRYTQHGSIPDIQRDLNNLRDEIRQRFKPPAVALPGLPDAPSEVTNAMLPQVWQQSLEQAHASLSEARAKLDLERHEMTARLEDVIRRREAADEHRFAEELATEREARQEAWLVQGRGTKLGTAIAG